MIYDVKVLNSKGELKQTITADTLLKQVWKAEGCPTKHVDELLEIARLKKDKKVRVDSDRKKCKYCPELFFPKFATSITCPKNKCKQRHYRERGAMPRTAMVCPKCNKTFQGYERSVYCNNPCVYTKKWKRKQEEVSSIEPDYKL